MAPNKTLLAAAFAVVLLSGCKREAEAPGVEAPADQSAQPAADIAPVPTEPDPAEAGPPAEPFNLSALPVTDKPLGEWPYLPVPEGYVYDEAETFDLSRVPFWTGQALEFVEGKVYQAEVEIPSGSEKNFSRFEVLKRIDEALTGLGASKVTTSELPSAVVRKDLPKNFGSEFYAGAGGYNGDQEVSTYVIRQADRVVWFKAFGDENRGSLLIAEAEPPAPGAPAAATQ